MLKLAFRTLPLFAVIVGFAMALGAYMNYSGVRGAYLDLIRSRMQMVIDDVGNNVESAVSVGIPPAEQVTLPVLLGRLAEADPLIVSIDVAAPDGKVLFSSAPDRVGAGLTGDDANTFALTRPVLNDFGAEVVRLVVRYDRTTPLAQVDRFGGSVLADAFPAGILAALAGSLVAFLVLSRLHRRADRVVAHRMPDTIDVVDREIDKLSPGEA